ncbi:MAG: aminotransferase class I/II-fold pyridoxal phosphate-dependent enzyme [Oscillospiraceae bacterium]|jgi:histidinol-phosphate aminotransferase|nr:aminotransferase class I/II-fold pyridoxal phosphate-dependent enzyme [Oscillospiraceae bacterium]
MKYISELARSLTPYVAGEQPSGGDWIKLNTNESPFPPAPGVANTIRSSAVIGERGELLRLYPDPDARELREALAIYHNISPDNLFIGNGSDEVLAFIFAAFFAGAPYATPAVGYSFYPSYARLFRAETRFSAMGEGMAVDTEALLSQNAPVILANPNAPTTRALSRDAILSMREALESRGRILVVDEAYAPFSDCSVIDRCAEYENLLVVRTFSKAHGLAGLRVGYAAGTRELIGCIARVRDSFNSYPVDSVAQAAAKAAVEDVAYVEDCVSKTRVIRDRSRDALVELGFTVFPSETNFLFVRHPGISGGELFAALKERRILVRHFGTPALTDYLRISIGTDEQMTRALDAIREIITGRDA